jgi:Na+-translocating ferredoxin:NAD+ oxidoreductase subunit B
MNTAAQRPTAASIDALLPQTQCARCGYDGCLPYAEAIAAGKAPINQCPPGGSATIAALAELLHTPLLPLSPANGVERAPLVAWIDETRCIGCARCLPPCPVDAIVGAPKFLHTVLADRCTGCELCIAPCPVDCIELRPAPVNPALQAPLHRQRYLAHRARLAARAADRQQQIDAQKAAAPMKSPPPR